MVILLSLLKGITPETITSHPVATDGGTRLGDKIEHVMQPICPECGVEGERQRKARGKTRCLECGEEYVAE